MQVWWTKNALHIDEENEALSADSHRKSSEAGGECFGKGKAGEEKRRSDKILDLASLEADRSAPSPYTQRNPLFRKRRFHL